MTEIKSLTDAELVEAVAREVMESPDVFNPFHDINDLRLVLERFDEWQITYSAASGSGSKKYWCLIWQDGFLIGKTCNENKSRAVLEAALMAERGK